VESDLLTEAELFGAVARSGARALLIGRQALIMLGLPVLTRDYDYWIANEDIEGFNGALEPLGLAANHTPAEARRRGRYVLENGEHVDVMVATEATTVDGERLRFADLWSRREMFDVDGVQVAIPALTDLMATKRLGGRPKDAEDLRMLRVLQSQRGD
jgi:hypothetical protein